MFEGMRDRTFVTLCLLCLCFGLAAALSGCGGGGEDSSVAVAPEAVPVAEFTREHARAFVASLPKDPIERAKATGRLALRQKLLVGEELAKARQVRHAVEGREHAQLCFFGCGAQGSAFAFGMGSRGYDSNPMDQDGPLFENPNDAWPTLDVDREFDGFNAEGDLTGIELWHMGANDAVFYVFDYNGASGWVHVKFEKPDNATIRIIWVLDRTTPMSNPVDTYTFPMSELVYTMVGTDSLGICFTGCNWPMWGSDVQHIINNYYPIPSLTPFSELGAASPTPVSLSSTSTNIHRQWLQKAWQYKRSLNLALD